MKSSFSRCCSHAKLKILQAQHGHTDLVLWRHAPSESVIASEVCIEASLDHCHRSRALLYLPSVVCVSQHLSINDHKSTQTTLVALRWVRVEESWSDGLGSLTIALPHALFTQVLLLLNRAQGIGIPLILHTTPRRKMGLPCISYSLILRTNFARTMRPCRKRGSGDLARKTGTSFHTAVCLFVCF